jgi:hypothetical protein
LTVVFQLQIPGHTHEFSCRESYQFITQNS